MAYPVRGLHYGPTLAVTLWTLAQAGSISGNQASRAGSVVLVLGSSINIVTGQPDSEGTRSLPVWHSTSSVVGIATSVYAPPRRVPAWPAWPA